MAKRTTGSRKKTTSTKSGETGTRSKTRTPRRAKPAAGSKPDPGTVDALARLHVWQIQAIRDVLLVAAVIAIVWAGYALRAVTVPLLVALLLAYLFEPIIERLVKHPKITRPVAVGGLLATIGVVLIILVALVLPLAVGQTTGFISDVRDGRMHQRVARLAPYVPDVYREDFFNFIDLLPEGAPVAPEPAGGGERDAAPETEAAAAQQPSAPTETPQLTEARARELIEEHLALERERLREELAAETAAVEEGGGRRWLTIARGSVNAIVDVFAAAVQIGLLSFLIPFYFFFFSLWYPEVVAFGRKLIPKKNRARALDLLGKMDQVVAGFVRGRIVISLIMGGMLALGWMICGVPYAVALGVVVGVFCAIPYLGVIGIPVAVGLLFFEQLGLPATERMAWWGVLLWPTLVFGIVQLVEGYVLTPTIAGKVTNLDPVTILVAVLAGGSVLGVYGMLLAIPLAACGKILFLEVLMPKVHAWVRGEVADPLPIDRE